MSKKLKVLCQPCREKEVSDPREECCHDCMVERVCETLDAYSVVDES